MTKRVCVGCDELIEDDYLDFNGKDWHGECFAVGGSSSYCCGIEYDSGEERCSSCGESL